MPTKKKQDSLARPAAKTLGQSVPKGVSALLGEEESTSSPKPAPAKPKKAASKSIAEQALKKEPRIPFTLKYRARYMDKLDDFRDFEKKRRKNRKLTKAELVEEALDLLFEKYAFTG